MSAPRRFGNKLLFLDFVFFNFPSINFFFTKKTLECNRTRDNVIEASIDHENGWLVTDELVDLYSTDEPQKFFHKRIEFCLDVHNEAVKSMRYPPDAYKKDSKKAQGGGDKPDDEEKSIEELIKEMEEDME